MENSARNNATVTVSIIGLSNQDSRVKKYLIQDDKKISVKQLNGYLLDSRNIIVKNSSSSIFGLPKMSYGSMANDNGYLVLDIKDREKLLSENANSKKLLNRLRAE